MGTTNTTIFGQDGATKECPGFDHPVHQVAFDKDHWRNDTIKYCRDCDRRYRKAHAGNRGTGRRRSAKRFEAFEVTSAPAGGEDLVPEEAMTRSHEYVPMKDLVDLWHAVVTGAKARPATNLMFTGPSGCGKTDGARHLAALVSLPFTKVDAASMTDPEAWFGTRELIVEDGHAVTAYEPSDFVDAITKPGVVLIDEITRVRDEHRNILLPLLDGTRQVTNPLTGEQVVRHPQCFVIMAGNVGINFTGTNAVDPAFLTRALNVEFDYIGEADERRVAEEATGATAEDVYVFVRFANETRAKAKVDEDIAPISTREVIEMGRLVADGLTRDLAAKFVVLNAASSEGGSASVRTELEAIWNGVRVTKLEAESKPDFSITTPTPAGDVDWKCPVHGKSRLIPAGVSSKTGKPYKAFRACPEYSCNITQDRPNR